MVDIFSLASRVVAWLGEGDDHAKQAMDVLKSIASQYHFESGTSQFIVKATGARYDCVSEPLDVFQALSSYCFNLCF
jgi:hypothetical protein